MTDQTKLPDDHPLMRAWNDYKALQEFEQVMQWLDEPAHKTNAVWTIFARGYLHQNMHYQQLRNESEAGAVRVVGMLKRWMPAIPPLGGSQEDQAAWWEAHTLVEHFDNALGNVKGIVQ